MAVQLALLAPLSLGLNPTEEHRCLCGMKAGECHCDLMAHSGKGHCGGAAKVEAQSRCSLHTPKSPMGETPRVSLDVRDRLAVLEDRGLAPRLDSQAILIASPHELLRSLSSPPESPPPRRFLFVA